MSLCKEEENGERKKNYKIDEKDIYPREVKGFDGLVKEKKQCINSTVTCIGNDRHLEAGIFLLCMMSTSFLSCAQVVLLRVG